MVNLVLRWRITRNEGLLREDSSILRHPQGIGSRSEKLLPQVQSCQIGHGKTLLLVDASFLEVVVIPVNLREGHLGDRRIPLAEIHHMLGASGDFGSLEGIPSCMGANFAPPDESRRLLASYFLAYAREKFLIWAWASRKVTWRLDSLTACRTRPRTPENPFTT